MNEKINIWHLIGSTSTILVFMLVGYGKLVTAENTTKENSNKIKELTKEARQIDKIIIMLENQNEDLKELKDEIKTFKKVKND